MMGHRIQLFFASLIFCLTACSTTEEPKTEIKSPSENISIAFFLDGEGAPHYLVTHKDETVIDTSGMGFEFKDQPLLQKGLKIHDTRISAFNETWEMPWGEQRNVVNHYNELIVHLEEIEAPQRKLSVIFRAFDDGIGFRYEISEQAGVDTIIIMDENTEFNITGDHLCWWAPGDWDITEHLVNTSPFSKIDALSKRDHPNLAQTYIPENAVNTPLTMRTASGLHLSFHEAALIDYSDMTLKVDPKNLSMISELVGSDRFGYKVKRALPFQTPWRTIQISEKAKDLIASKLILNLNEPNKLGDVSWFKPMKYVGIWWEMHLGVSTWDYAGSQDMGAFIDFSKMKPTGRHGATTANAKRYIDFAAANGFGGVLIEGWNTGWERWIGFDDREGVFDFVTPYPDYDLEEVVRYCKEKGVSLIMHHETSSAPRTYDQQLDTAYALMKRLGIHSVKTGYVGKIIPKGEYHHGQWMINHFQKVIETAARYNIAVDAHEPIKDTGERRTYPNVISREGLRGQEFNAWATDGGNPPEHIALVAFTRMLGGPIDFTPGAFELSLKDKPNNQINTTLAQQLALYVVLYSPIQMACDLPQNYEGQPAFQFIRDVGVDWEQTVVLDGEVGEFVTIARQEKGTNNWFLGSISDENERSITVKFDFLEAGKEYDAVIYKDGADSHWKDNATSIEIEKAVITKNTEQTFRLAPGGGLAVSLIRK